MQGTIRPREASCPDCRKPFAHYPKVGYICKAHHRRPDRFMIDLWWRGKRHRIYSDEHGFPIESYKKAESLLYSINMAIENGTFDPTRFTREDKIKYSLKARWNIYRDMQRKAGYIDLLKVIESKVFSYFKADVSIRDITQVDINLFAENLLEGGLSDSTAKMYTSTLIACLNYSRNQGLISQGFVMPKLAPALIAKSRQDKKAKRVPEVAEAFKVFSFIPEEERLPYLFTATHLCRPNETRALQARDFDFNKLTVKIQRGFSGDVLGPSKVGETEANATEIPLHPSMVEPMRRLCISLEPHQHVFSYKGKFIKESRFYYVIKTAMEAAKITDTTPYMLLKHAQASMLASQTGDIRNTSKLCRHTNTATTEKYARAADLKKLREIQASIQVPRSLIPRTKCP